MFSPPCLVCQNGQYKGPCTTVAKKVFRYRSSCSIFITDYRPKKRVRGSKFWNKSQNFIPHTALQVSAFESHLSQIKMPHGTNKYTFSEQRNVECFYTWTSVFICRIHICIQYIFFFFKVTYKQYQQMKIFCFQIKCIYSTLCQSQKEN